MHYPPHLWLSLPIVLSLTATSSVSAADLVVTVSGIRKAKGEIGVALFSSATGFPLDTRDARQIWLPAPGSSSTTVQHTFADLAPGRYAAAVSHDLNGNRKTDTNWLGMPLEPWGVSNGIRPRLRAPTFSEALIEISAGTEAVPAKITVSLRD